MDVIHRCCSGLDVHKETVQACIRRLDEQGKVAEDLRRFGTTTNELLALNDWLAAAGVTHVAMESTGVFWKPVYNILEGHFELLLCNARHIRNVPGRKTDVKDSQWIAQLLQHGLLSPSFVPPQPVRELRDLTRTRASVQDDITRVANRIHKILEDANIKLGNVATDILGVSGRAMLRALIDGERDAGKLAELAKRGLRQKIPQLKEALNGRVTEHHRFMLRLLMEELGSREATVKLLDERIAETMQAEEAKRKEEAAGGPKNIVPFLSALNLLVEMWGINRRSAENIVAEIGTDMSRFPSEAQFTSWAGMCPGNNRSAGRDKSVKTRKGNNWLRRALVQAAWASTRAKGSFLAARYKRLVPRRGKQCALIAIAHSLLKSIYQMLKSGQVYKDLGAGHYDSLNRQSHKGLVRRLEQLGFEVKLTPRVAS
jgi:transposase